MSLVDPTTRWWRQARFLRRLVLTVWLATFAVAVYVGWFLPDAFGGTASPSGIESVALGALIALTVGAVVLDAVTSEARDATMGWEALRLFAVVGAGAGLGIGMGGEWIGWCIAAAGSALLLVQPITAWMRGRRASKASALTGRGVRVTATITDVKQVFRGDAGSYTRHQVTVTFTDSTGIQRWHRQMAPAGFG